MVALHKVNTGAGFNGVELKFDNTANATNAQEIIEYIASVITNNLFLVNIRISLISLLMLMVLKVLIK